MLGLHAACLDRLCSAHVVCHVQQAGEAAEKGCLWPRTNDTRTGPGLQLAQLHCGVLRGRIVCMFERRDVCTCFLVK